MDKNMRKDLSAEQYDILCINKSKEYINNKNPTIFDVGANIGKFINLFDNLKQNSDPTYYCFEPNRTAFNTLTNFAIQKKCILNNIGLGEEVVDTTLYYPSKFTSLGSMVQRPEFFSRVGEFGELLQQEMKVLTVDYYLKQNEINFIDYLKIDTEGLEFSVLKGCEEALKNKAILCGQFEYGTTFEDAGITLVELVKYLNNYEYFVFDVESQTYVDHTHIVEYYHFANYFFHK
jgi:FkbM family methyltransferase